MSPPPAPISAAPSIDPTPSRSTTPKCWACQASTASLLKRIRRVLVILRIKIRLEFPGIFFPFRLGVEIESLVPAGPFIVNPRLLRRDFDNDKVLIRIVGHKFDDRFRIDKDRAPRVTIARSLVE